MAPFTGCCVSRDPTSCFRMAPFTGCCVSRDPTSVDARPWNKLIKQQVLEGNPDCAILTYRRMLEAGQRGDNFTFPIIVKAAALLSSSRIGLILHAHTIKTGFWIHTFVQTSLLNLYSNLGYVEGAYNVFKGMSERDLTAWNSMLDAYASAGQMDAAADLLDSMLIKDAISFNIMIAGYANMGSIDLARSIFDEIQGDIISWNSMIRGYCRVGEIGMAVDLFDRMPKRNVISWNTMIGGYLENELYHDAICLFDEMNSGGTKPDYITLSSVLSACTRMGSLEAGGRMHIYAANIGFISNPHVVTSLIDMYAKCGSIERALEVFYKTRTKNIFCWNAIISGLALHGNGHATLKLFEEMKTKGVKPDDLTFIGLLSACSHAGLVEEGCELFVDMENKFGVSPKTEHYGCMVDLLGRAGFLSRAYELIKTMPFAPGASVLGAMISACIIHQDLEMGEIIAHRMAEKVDQLTDGEYMMLSNLYATCGKWDEADRWRRMMNDRGVKKTAGCSMIEVNGKTHKFFAGYTIFSVQDSIPR